MSKISNKAKAIALGICSVPIVAGIIAGRQATNTLTYPIEYSAEAIEHLTGKWEGCRTKAYKDTGGLWTQGVGHLCGKLKPTETLTLEQVADLLNADLYKAEQCVMTHFNGKALTQGQREALTDFAFNVGCAKATKNSTGKMTKIRIYALTKQYDKMCNEFLNWSYGRDEKGKMVRIQGLYNRRLDEQKWCLK